MQNVRYDVRDPEADYIAEQLKAQGEKVLQLNLGNPNAFGFRTPSHIIEEQINALRENKNGYVHELGLDQARSAVARECERKGIRNVGKDDVVMTNGVSEGIWIALGALVNAGEDVLVPSPDYPLYSGVLNFLEARPNFYRTIEADGWIPDIRDIERKIGPRTRAIIVNSPNNPTGALYPTHVLSDILGIAKRHDLVVLSDEIYSRIVFDGKTHVSMASLPEADEASVVVFNGMSKNYVVPGGRAAWMVFAGDKSAYNGYKEAVCTQARLRVCAAATPQYAVQAALEGPQTHIDEMNAQLQARRDLAFSMLNSLDGVSCTKPEAAFYMFPQIRTSSKRGEGLARETPLQPDRKFVHNFLRSKHVRLVHGTGMDHPTSDHARLVILPEEEVLRDAIGRLGDHVRELYA